MHRLDLGLHFGARPRAALRVQHVNVPGETVPGGKLEIEIDGITPMQFDADNETVTRISILSVSSVGTCGRAHSPKSAVFVAFLCQFVLLRGFRRTAL